MEESKKMEEHIFSYPWETVVKAFLNKYPSQHLDFVKFNRVVEMKILDDNCVLLKRVMFSKKYRFMWVYSLEEIKIDFKKRLMEMETSLLKKSNLVPNFGAKENVIYKSWELDPLGKTFYGKVINSTSKLQKYMGEITQSFKKGCKIIENKCEEFAQTKDSTSS